MPQLARTPVPDLDILVPSSRDNPFFVGGQGNGADVVAVRECRVGLPIMGARKAFGGAVGGGGVEVRWIGKRGGGWCEGEGVYGSFVGNKG